MTSDLVVEPIASAREAYGLSGLRSRPSHGVQVADYEPGVTFGPRRLPEYEWVWLLQGSAWWQGSLGEQRFRHRLVPGTLLLARAGMRDSYAWDPKVVSRHAFVHFRIDAAPGALPPAEQDWPTVRDLDVSPVLGGVCRYLLDLAGDTSEMAAARTEQLLTLLLDIFVAGPTQPRPRLDPHLADLVQLVRRTWWAEGMRIVEVGELARGLRLSAGHVFRLFSAEFGLGPAAALELVRLARAAILLQRSNESLAEIARQTGFANAYHLSRRFRATYALPPGRFRQLTTQPDPMGPLADAGLTGLGHLLLNAPPVAR